MQLSIQAGELVGKIHDRFLTQYNDPLAVRTQHSLNILCVRLVFCLYADDAGLFGRKDAFKDYIGQYQPKDMRNALIDIFHVLDAPLSDRADMYLSDELMAFPYVNGGLFADENIVIPKITDEIKEVLMQSCDFDWSQISPTIFGAVFESTLNPETRRSGGMHYTSIENIHKVIDPLFLNDLRAELQEIENIPVLQTQKKRLNTFHDKLASLTFLDPACGSGNFLTETFLSLRRIENEVIRLKVANTKNLARGQIALGITDETSVKVSINQLYGIEINDFACKVAQAALWIAESQMIRETEAIINQQIDFLPLKTYDNIVEGNSLQLDWNRVVQRDRLSFIMGNPPFVGFTYMSAEQKKDMDSIFPKVKNLDYVAAWYKLAYDYIKDTDIECGFVSTNSITQGETVARLWEFIDIKINFAYRTFIWESEALQQAHVHCVIIGFADFNRKQKLLFDGEKANIVENINAYLCDAPNVIVKSRNRPLSNIPPMVYGNKPADGGFLIIENDDYDSFISSEPQAKALIKPLLGAVEYLHNKKRWCIWLDGVSPATIQKCPHVLERVRQCKEARENSIAVGIRKFAKTPTLFAQITQPVGKDYILVPRVSSERRRYVPMGFLDGNTIVTDAVQIVPNATLYEFGILTSNVHMAWMRVICGRLKSDYRYSKDVVYNNFPWPAVTNEQRIKIEKSAQGILDVRALYLDSSLADLYDPLTMPPELTKAHQANDRAVMQAYGLNVKTTSEEDCVAHLFNMYQELIKEAQNK